LKRDAEAYLDAQSKLVRDSEYIEPATMTFAQFATEWLEKYPKLAQLKDSTWATYHNTVHRHLIPAFGSQRLTSIKAAAIEKDFKASLADDRTPKTQRNILLVLRVMLETAVTWDYLRVNPFHVRGKVKLPKRDDTQKGRALKPEEIRNLLENCLDDCYTIVATAVFTGMRRGEIFGPSWEDVDFDKNQIQVKRAIHWRFGKVWQGNTGYRFVAPKSKKSIRSIDMSSKLRSILLEYKMRKGNRNTGLVFDDSNGEPMNPQIFVRDQFKPAVQQAGLGELRLHDLRHTFGSLKIEQGENLKYIQTQMGHSSIKITLDIYGHLLKDTNPEAAERTDRLVFGTEGRI